MSNEYEVIGAEIPEEPPVGTAVITGRGKLMQRLSYRSGGWPFALHQSGWFGVALHRYSWQDGRRSWLEVLEDGAVTVVYRPAPSESNQTAL